MADPERHVEARGIAVPDQAAAPGNAVPEAAGHGNGGERHLARSFWLLRLAGCLAISSALIGLVVIYIVEARGLFLFVVEGAVLLAIGFAGDMALRWVEARLRREREQSHRLWLSRQAELQEIATKDDLTQLQNRRFFYERLQGELDKAISRRQSLSIIMIDVDDLKAINDEFGHQVGDVVLRQFGRILNHKARDMDVTARLGGDEFAVIMPGADRREADQFAWKLWDELGASPVYENGHASIYLGVSVGVGGYPWGGTDLEEIIHWADAKLYANKLERKGFHRQASTKGDSRLASAVVEVLSTALDVRDKMTHRHSRRVARMAASVARQMGLSQDQVLEIEYAAALHDIGKIGVADSILRKAEPLEPEEWKEMRRHSQLGYEILNGIDFLRNAAEIVYAHHERWDGTGYPRGMVAEEIPLGSRVFAVVDAFDAMTSRRPYREAMTRDLACIEIARNSGSQFDPVIVEAFLVVIRRSPDGFYNEEEQFGSRVQVATPAGHGNGTSED
ncbi:MAG TPA: diguanylate cyclase [Dehalococcoidia bacterium]|nr:diguanylate cyclase [Dehalococcoidia bacterium]